MLDVHLMIEQPERQIEAFAEAGADSITFHVEATPHANRTLAAIRELGCLAGIALNPGTPVEAVTELRDLADIVLCMTINPGWGGQSFIAGSPDKVSRLAPLVGKAKIEVDGGIDTSTAGSVADGRRLPLRRRLGRLRRRRPRRRLHRDRRSRRRGLAARDQRSDYLLPPGLLGGVVADTLRPGARTSEPAARRSPTATAASEVSA